MNVKRNEVRTSLTPLKIHRDCLKVLNQQKLPNEIEWIACSNESEVADSIRKMHVRGAPAIGIAAAYGYYLGIWQRVAAGKKISLKTAEGIKEKLNKSRPTAVNLFWATEQMHQLMTRLCTENQDTMTILLKLFEKACSLHTDDADRCLKMSVHAAHWVRQNFPDKKLRILTHCNAGALATGGIGTALGVIRVLASEGLVEMVYADETRPWLQGSRLTAWELKKDKIPVTIQTDSTAAVLMQKGMIDFIVVGADRIASNLDTANKIGTYSLAILAGFHGIPFLVIAPRSTFDLSLHDGSGIPIEERNPNEVLMLSDQRIAAQVTAINYSFDVTPAELITELFHEDGMEKRKRG